MAGDYSGVLVVGVLWLALAFAARRGAAVPDCPLGDSCLSRPDVVIDQIVPFCFLRYWGTIGRCPDARSTEDERRRPGRRGPAHDHARL